MEIVLSSISNGRIISLDVERTTIIYPLRNTNRIINNKVPSFAVKTLKSLEDLQYVHELAQVGEVC